MKLLISMKNQIIKKSFKKIERIENNNKLDIINSLENKLKKIKNFLIKYNYKNYMMKIFRKEEERGRGRELKNF